MSLDGKHIHNRVLSVQSTLSKAERKIADYILNEPQAAITMTASQLAKASDTSPASVIRFCRSIGISSFTELKVKLSAELDAPSVSSYSDITPNESPDTIKNKLLNNAIHTLTETVQLMDESVNATVDALYQTDMLFVYGIGASGIVAENIAQKFNRVGKTAMAFQDHHLLLTTMSSLGKNGLLMVVSNSGETSEILHIVKIAKQIGCQTVGVTQFGKSPLNQLVDWSLHTYNANEGNFRSAATSSLLNQFMVIDILFYNYVTKYYQEFEEKIVNSREMIQLFEDLIK
ncbi:MurR/RpiR family transcriptional regulator [Vagococcus zengguangii]|uniref:MurR/RpiR family transcriptional regulator n=1 Tax=Vagococcus zengguangii TaxID=2571750 RepID=A0A4D7CS20_9ENTE|nr:MurR/RpiR family transcriptional regulator [Vagococcus zengguangii]QCI85823.1 MurR/RpiR family transcriptional regulator [Vagococcus zengguangii]TLG81764.1 MurR/RpiR family transcriptional regulator [Vagococcus zengguangii]